MHTTYRSDHEFLVDLVWELKAMVSVILTNQRSDHGHGSDRMIEEEDCQIRDLMVQGR